MEKLIKKIASTIMEGDVFICWSGVYFDISHSLIRADKLYLNVVRKVGGVVTYSRFVRVLVRGHRGEPHIMFNTKQPMYRIISGKRRGMIVELDSVLDDESWVLAGIEKEFFLGGRKGFSKRRKGDRKIAKLLTYLPECIAKDETTSLAQACPRLLLSCDPSHDMVYLRGTGKALSVLKALDGYNARLTPADNFDNVKESLGFLAGNGKIAYPYDIVYGRGIVTAAPASSRASLGIWYKVPSVKIKKADLEIK